MITRDKALMDNGVPSQELIRGVVAEFQKGAVARTVLWNYYQRQHDILNRTRVDGLPNNKLVHDFPGYIVNMAVGYLVGNAVGYSVEGQEAALAAVLDAYKRDSVDSVDSEIAVDASVFGVGVEICYAGQDSKPHTSRLDRRSAFVVYDDTVEHQPLFGVHWLPRIKADGTSEGFRAWVYTNTSVMKFEGPSVESLAYIDEEAHFFGIVPIVEYWNNPRETGDFEPVLSLIDAYDGLQSDRINDKQQFVDAILILFGVTGLQPSTDESDSRTQGQRLRDEGVLVLPDAKEGGGAQWLTKQLTEQDVEVLKDAVKADIHKFSMVPDLTDQEFAGNSSGVAMKFKLLGLEQLTKVKERWFREGLRWRLRLFSNFLSIKGAPALDADAVTMTFTRSLPVNDAEIAQMVQNLQGIVPDKILLGQIPFISDVDKALEMLVKQKAEAMKQQAEAFGAYPGQGSAGIDPGNDPGAGEGAE